MPDRVLYQFPISHFCEKARWNLDAKGLRYRTVDVPPGFHLLVLRRFGKRTTVPLLVDGDAVFTDSTSIAHHLDRAYPERPLLPADPTERARARELEAWFGKGAGRAVRVWMYGQLGRRDGGMVERLFRDYAAPVRRAGELLGPLLERGMRKRFGIDAEGVAKARARIDEAFDRLERETSSDPLRYLVGSALTIADVTAASLLAPLVAPPGSPWDDPRAGTPDEILRLRDELAPRPGWRWVLARYTNDRARRAS
jgi:glutathione S-transferase